MEPYRKHGSNEGPGIIATGVSFIFVFFRVIPCVSVADFCLK
jgi:hypothetical protein